MADSIPSEVEIEIKDLNATRVFMKSKTVREGDYIWFRGKKRLWRTLSKEERKIAIKDLKEEQKSSQGFLKRKNW